MSIFAELLTVAKLIDNYDIDATGGGLWASTTTYKATVPVGKRWFFIGGTVNRTVSATLQAQINNAADKLIMYLGYASAATGKTAYPNTVESGTSMCPPGFVPMDVGMYVLVTFGAAQNASAEASCLVLEVDV